MSTDFIVPQELKKSVVSETHLTFDGLSFDEWVARGSQIRKLQGASFWWLGEWINHGKNVFGKKYSDALKIFDYDYQSLVNIAFVCAHVAPENRDPKLSFSHHREVCGFEPDKQKAFLADARKNEWSVAELRRSVRAAAPLAGGKKNGRRTFNVVRWSMEGASFFRDVEKKEPIEKMPRDRRLALARDLQPLVTIYQRLIAVR